MKLLKKIVKCIGILLLVVILLGVAFFASLMILEYKPADSEPAEQTWTVSETEVPAIGQTLTVMTWNTGYGALGDNADFFMDGGTMVNTADKERVQQNIEGIRSEIEEISPDVVFLQEADRNSTRSHHTDMVDELANAYGGNTAFAPNFKTWFLPYPWPPIGKVYSGVGTMSDLTLESSVRLSLPCPYSWPVSMVNLKRCLLVSRVPIDGSDRELVLVNLHLEAYDSGEGKIEQTKMLRTVLQEEVDKGNYVIAGGDFNQIFSNIDVSAYPVYEGTWQPGYIDVEDFGEDLSFYTDSSSPTCRSLDKVYAGADHDTFQYYVLDGFIVSSNLTVESVETRNLDFVNSDHNPVVIRVTLNE
jgi:endonuclease/exonuclease/phosphatase family metal-dependent hydrolase